MVDEQSCIQEVQNLIRTFRGSDRHRWLEIFLKTEEYLQENSLKQKLSILDALRTYILKNGDFAVLLNEDDLQTVISIWCTIYLGSLRNLKLCQKVRKIFIAISNLKPSYTEYEMKRNIRQLLSLQMSEHVSIIEAICQLIDICDLGRKCVQDLFDHFLATISHCLDSYCQELQCTEGGELLTVHNIENCQGFLKAALKTFQYFPSEIKHLLSGEPPNSVDPGNLAEILQTFISNLWKVLFCEDVPKECTLLCGTAVGLLLGIICTELKIFVSTRESIIQLLLVAGASSVKNQEVTNPGILKIGCFKFRLPAAKYKPTTQLSIVMGILKSQKNKIFLATYSETLHKEESKKQTTLVEGLLFKTIYDLCLESKNSPVHYLAFEAMRQWLLCIKNLLQCSVFPKDSTWLTRLDSFHASRLIDVIWENLEDPIDGVPSLVVTLFGMLLELHKKEEALKSSSDEQFYEALTEKALGVVWHVKGRYGLICALLPYVGLQQIIGKSPTILDDMIHCLGVNQLTSPSTSAFKAFLEWERSHQEGPATGKQDQSKISKDWQTTWKGALYRALTSRERLLQQNACLYWLPCALKCYPELLHSLLQHLRSACEKCVRAAETSRCFLAYLSVLKVSRSLSLLQAEDLDEAALHQGLTHLEDDIRSTALSVISFTPKTAEPLSEIEQKLLREFLPFNLNTASAPFRQTLFVSLKKILGRVRDSSLILLKEHKPIISQEKTYHSSSINQHSLHLSLKSMFEFVTWLFDLAVGCFFPGATYQRQKSAIQVLEAILEVFWAKWQPDKKKGQPRASCHILLSLANQHGYLKFFSPRCSVVLCGCIESPYPDIRGTGGYLLKEYFPWPLIVSEDDSTGILAARMLIRKALSLARSPRVQDCESAAVLFQLMYLRYALVVGWEMKLSDVDTDLVIIDGTLLGDERPCSSVKLLQQLLVELKLHVEATEKDIKVAAQNAPGHGISLALAHCIEAGFCKDVECRDHLPILIKDTVDTAVHIIYYMLDMLSGNHSTEAIGGASFADIGQALEEILSLSEMDVETEDVQSSKDAVISCCWLHIKCACHLLAAIFEKASMYLDCVSKARVVSEETLKLMAETTWKVIIQCRHQGVVQHCRGSFVRICQCLFRSSHPCLQTLPKSWLDDVLSTVSSASSVTSVTRRSAGLPVVICVVLSCEQPSNQRPLLQQCMESLLNTAALPLPSVIDQHKDLPQVHAINILKALYQEASLGPSVLQYASKGTIMAVSGFASSSWAVRNASMQLFGSLVKRLLGHQRGSDDDSERNTISARDFFISHPDLHNFFLSHIQSTADPISSPLSLCQLQPKPELFPILTLLSKLHPCPKADESSSGLLSCFVPHIISLSSCPSYAVRVVAAKALVPFIPTDRLLDTAKELVVRLPSGLAAFSQNFLHGTLLQIRILLEAAKLYSSGKSDGDFLTEMLNKIWICTARNPCYLTRATFLSIITSFGLPFRRDFEFDFASLQSIVVNSLQALDCESIHSLLGHSQWVRELVTAYLELYFQHSRCEGTNFCEEGGLLSHLLSSPFHEIKLVCLQYLSKEYLVNETPLVLLNSLQLDLANLLIKDVDYSCLMLALDIFVEVFGRLDMLKLSSVDLEKLWTKITMCARKSCGISVAGRAIPACSVILNHVMKIRGRLDVAAKLFDWKELVSCYCQWDQDELLRLGAVQGLKQAGITLLQCASTPGQESYFYKAAVSILHSTLFFLQDEEEDIRNTAAEFAAFISEPTSSVTCSAAIPLVLQYMVEHFSLIPECWVALETITKGQKSTEDVLKVYVRSKQMLFEQEDSNLYAEPVILAKMAVDYLKQIVNKILRFSESEALDNSPFTNWFVTACETLTNNVQALINSGIKEYGSLQNAKLYIVRFRIMCMAEVLLFAVKSGLQTSVCLKATNTMKEPLMLMLEDLPKVNVQPSLTEYARKLKTILNETEFAVASGACRNTTSLYDVESNLS